MTSLIIGFLLAASHQASVATSLGQLYLKYQMPVPHPGCVPGWIDRSKPGSKKPVGFIAWIPKRPGIKDYYEAPDYHRIATSPFLPIPAGRLTVAEKPASATVMAAQCSAHGFAPIAERLVADLGIGKDLKRATRYLHDGVWAYWMDMAEKTRGFSGGRALGVLSHTPQVDGIPLSLSEQKFLASMKRH